MRISLIICTYMRPEPLLKLLHSVKIQSLYPDEILIIDGSLNRETDILIGQNHFKNLKYFLVDSNNRGLTKQRNFGIKEISDTIDIVCFLDDDTILEKDYFEELIKTFNLDGTITGVGGVAINENNWKPIEVNKKYSPKKYYFFDGYIYREGQRNVVRNYLRLQSNLRPGKMPNYSHGRTCGFPLNGKNHEVDLLIGMSMAFRKNVVDQIQFSSYFEGYGLYEDADFSIRSLQFGKNVINTKVQLCHFHEPFGRPNQFKYGKMVVRNGWYVWRVKNPSPSFQDCYKWNAITILLILIRFTNAVKGGNKKEAFIEAVGRTIGWWSLFFNKPKQR